MKAKLSLILATVCLITIMGGCVTQRVQTVGNQVYTCTKSPTLKAEIREDLEFVGRTKASEVTTAPDFAGEIEEEVIIFGASDEDGKITKGLLFISEKMLLRTGIFVMRGCERAEKGEYFHNGYITENLTRICRKVGILRAGYANRLTGNQDSRIEKHFSGPYLYERKYRITDGTKILYTVIYLESIQYTARSQWNTMDEDRLLPKEKEKYQTFLANARTAFKKLP